MSILLKNKCNDIKTIIQITNAVYIMKSTTEKNKYRIGCIGLRGVNNALSRLGQCIKFNHETRSFDNWIYLRIKVLDDNKKSSELEQKLRQKLILSKGYFKESRIGKTDSFICNSERKLISIFDSIFK